MRTALAILLGCTALALLGLSTIPIPIPKAWNPWAPLDVAAPMTPVTQIKLRILRHDPAMCRAALALSGLAATPVPDTHPAPGCGLTDGVRVAGGAIRMTPGSFLASCPLGVDWALFQRQILSPLAEADFGSPVSGIRHLGSYNCRDIRAGSSLSAHATANALDLSEIILRDGTDIPVATWNGSDKRAAFLHGLRDGACRVFGVVLSPDFNADHRNHLHLQATGWGFCR